MGNLYTQIVRRQNGELTVLSELRALWQSYPRDYKKIKELQKILDNIEANKKKRVNQPSKRKSGIQLGYERRLREEVVNKQLSKAVAKDS